MTKGDLLRALEPFTDDQYVFVNLHSDTFPHGSQVIIQGVDAIAPWHPGKPALIGIRVHAGNRELPSSRKTE